MRKSTLWILVTELLGNVIAVVVGAVDKDYWAPSEALDVTERVGNLRRALGTSSLYEHYSVS